MATPNQMPKRPNALRQQLLAGLIETKPSSWKAKTLSKDDDGNEIVETTTITSQVLRHPLAHNMSEASVEALSKRWIS